MKSKSPDEPVEYKKTIFQAGEFNDSLDNIEIDEHVNKIRNTQYFINKPLNVNVNNDNSFYNRVVKSKNHGVLKKIKNVFFGEESDSNETMNMNTNISSNINSTKENINSSNIYMFIPCTNCDNLIHIDDLNNHSDVCYTYIDQTSKIIESQSKIKKADAKLKKLLENIDGIENGEIFNTLSNECKDNITQLKELLLNSLNIFELDHKTLVSLKNNISGIDNLIKKYNGSMSTLIIFERAKIIVLEKFNYVKEDLKKTKVTEISQKGRKGAVNLFKTKLEEIQKEIEEEDKAREKENIFQNINMQDSKEKIHQEASNHIEEFKQENQEEKEDDNNKNDIELVKSNRKKYLFKSRLPTVDLKTIDDEFNLLDVTNPEENDEANQTNFIEEINSNVCKKLESDYTNTITMSINQSDCSKDAGVTSTDAEPKINRFRFSKFRGGLNRSNISEKNLNNSEEDSINNSRDSNIVKKQSFKEFAKIVLKIKFEKLSSTHSGQLVSERLLYNEVKKKQISMDKWTEFCLCEMINNSNIYILPDNTQKISKQKNRIK